MPPSKLLESIYDLYNGGSPMSSQIARKVVQAFQKMGLLLKIPKIFPTVNMKFSPTSPKGIAIRKIADILSISIETVRTHLRNIYEKLSDSVPD